MKILITNYHLDGGGGHTTYILSLLRAVPTDIQVYVACPGRSRLFQLVQERHPAIVALDVEFPGKLRELANIIRQFKKFQNFVKKYRFDLIHVNGSPDHRMVMLSHFFLAAKNRPRVVFTKHNSLTIKNSWLTEFRFHRYCDVVILVCAGLEILLPDKMRANKRIVTIENGVDTRVYSPAEFDQKQSMRRKLGLHESTLVFASCAGSALHKGWQFLADATSGDPGIAVIVIGKKPDVSTIKRIFPNGLPSQVIFTGYQSSVREFLAAADIGFVLSTAIETASFACREMMSMGLPVLVSNYGFLSNNVDHNSGWVVESGSSDSIKRLLPQIKMARLDQMGTSARERAVKLYDREIFETQTFQVYKDTVAK